MWRILDVGTSSVGLIWLTVVRLIVLVVRLIVLYGLVCCMAWLSACWTLSSPAMRHWGKCPPLIFPQFNFFSSLQSHTKSDCDFVRLPQQTYLYSVRAAAVVQSRLHEPCSTLLFMFALWNRETIFIFMLWFVLSSFFFFPRLISAAADWLSAILPHMVRI